jgi:dTDP-4-amino-4,6-dideoxygalactose transaminase
MSPGMLAQKLKATPSAKAVIPVHMAGLAHGTAEIRKFAGRRVVIEDAAHALGGLYSCSKPIGSCAYSDLTVFSFHPVKQITTGEGGAVLTNDPELARRLRLFRSHGIEREAARFNSDDTKEDGRVKPWLSEQQLLGFNYRMTDIAAALGLSQLKKLDRFLERRRAIVRRYDEAFVKLSPINLPQSAPEERARSGHHLYVVVFDFPAMRTTRTAFMLKLAERGVGSQVHYMPVYRHPFHAQRNKIDQAQYPNAERYYRGCLSLPLHPGLNDEEVERVIDTVTDLVSAV